MHVQRYKPLFADSQNKNAVIPQFYPEKEEFVDDLIKMIDHIYAYEFKTFTIS